MNIDREIDPTDQFTSELRDPKFFERQGSVLLPKKEFRTYHALSTYSTQAMLGEIMFVNFMSNSTRIVQAIRSIEKTTPTVIASCG